MSHITQNNDEVICPKCVHQFRAIPVNIQKMLLSAGYEPPFLSAALAQPEPHLFEFWWAEHMPDATQEQAFKAWSAAPSSKGVGVTQPAQQVNAMLVEALGQAEKLEHEALVALSEATYELKVGNPYTTATDTYKANNDLIHRLDKILNLQYRDRKHAALTATQQAQPEPMALKWTPVVEWWESGNEDFEKLKDAVMQMLAAAKAARPEPVESADDPLQGAVDWLLLADGEYFAVATVQRTLRIGYNRAQRLSDIAKERAAAKGGA